MATNYERIKNMTVEEMAEFSSVFQRCTFCSLARRYKSMTEVDVTECNKIGCKEGIKKWLQAESEE